MNYQKLLRHKKLVLATLSTATLVALLAAFFVPAYMGRMQVQASSDIVSFDVGINTLAPGDEVVSARTLTSETHYVSGNTYAVDASIGNVHYADTQGNLQPIDQEMISATPQEAPWAYKTRGQAGFQAFFANNFSAGMIGMFQVGSEYVRFQPYNLYWTNDSGATQTAGTKASPNATISNPVVPLLADKTTHQGTITWDSAYGAGTHFSWINEPTRLAKQLVVDSLASLRTIQGSIRNGANPCLDLNLIFLPSNGVTIWADGTQWDKVTTRTTFNTIEFRNSSGQVLWGFNPLMYWDAAGVIGQSVATLRWTGAYLIIEVRVPYAWLSDSARVWPVYIDTNVDAQVSATANDGHAYATYSFSSTTMQIGDLSGARNSFALWSGITIAQSSTISAAYITYQANNYSGTLSNVKTRIYFDSAASPTAPTTAATYNGKGTTTAYVDWTPAVWSSGVNYNTPSIVSVIQELVNASGYSSGSMQALHKNNSSSSNTNIAPKDYSVSSSAAPKLHIEYSSSTYNLTNDPSSKDFGSVLQSTTYYAKGSAPSNPVVDGDCTFTITNSQANAIKVNVTGANFTGGVGSTLTSGAPGADTIRETVYYSGQNPASGVVLTTSAQTFIASLSSSATIKWDMKLEVGTASDGVQKSGTITLTGLAP